MKFPAAKYIPFSYKMMIPFLALVLLTDFVIGYYSYYTASKSRTELVLSNVSWTLQQMSDNIHYKMADSQAVADSLFSSIAFQQYLQTTGSDLRIYETMTSRLLPLMETAVRMSLQDLRLIVYVNNREMNEIFGKLQGSIQDQSYHILSSARVATSPWYSDVQRSPSANEWRQVEDDQERGNISLLRKLISFEDFSTEIGYLRLIIPIDKLFISMNDLSLKEGTIIRVSDRREQAVIIQNAAPSDKLNEEHYFVVSEEIPDTEFTLEALVPKHIFQADAVQIRRVTLLVCGLTFLIFTVIAFVVARYNNRRITRILTSVQAFRTGEFKRKIPVEGKDEFALISHTFNEMALHIDELIREVYIQGIQKKEKELEALQAQINPHFLYNTLSSINSLAHIGETQKLSAMVSALTSFYRLTLNNGELIILVQDEIKQIQAYLQIQAIKYANRFTVSYNVDERAAHCRTIKLLLQPFVENVFKHAWYEEHIHIRIDVYIEENNVVFKIIDNGIGMNPNVLEQLYAKKSGDSGYGIRNVQERIQLHYGDAYGVQIRSRAGMGTAVKLTIPYVMQADRIGAEAR